MATKKYLKIGEVVARTGLTERAIRHYEECGLLAPDRSAAGQRLYDAQCLERLAATQILRRANFSIPEIAGLLMAKVDARTLVRAQIESIEATLHSARASLDILRAIDLELANGNIDDVDVLCRLVSAGEACAPDPRWRAIFDRYFSADRQAAWVELQGKMRAAIADPAAYNDDWARLAADIKSELPIDPASPGAQALLARWDALMAPFNVVASAREKKEAGNFWSRVGEWGSAVDQPVTQSVVDFIKAARLAREKVGP